ncbi:MAG TPA: VOC family protein [Pyrinomonadaceae bacterium]|nr:VOC family protein [Pyrinomonadaceae bacterium]HMP64523.1 VOC family protein [Pyrinomonadaceae bacterium]
MSEKVNPIPQGYEGVTPYLICKNAEAAINFYTRAFGAQELFRIGGPGMVGHAELKIGNAIIMMADEFPDSGAVSPETVGGTPVHLMIYVEDVDAFTEKAVSEGLEVLRPVQDQFYGDRSGQFKDPFGHVWAFATHIEDLTPEEMNERAAAAYGG